MFVPTTPSLVWISLVGLAAYAVSSLVLIAARRRYEARARVLGRMEALLNGWADGRPARDRITLASLATASLRDVALLVRDPYVPRPVLSLLAESLVERLGLARVLHAAGLQAKHGTKWRRIEALRTLAFARNDEAWDSLERALAEGNSEVKAAAVSLLGRLGDRRAAAILVGALRTGSFSRSRIAAAVDAITVDVSDLIAPLMTADDALVRFWATTLMQRYPEAPELRRQLAGLMEDHEPIVRKAAIDAVRTADEPFVMSALRARLADEAPFVRAHAARAMFRLQGPFAARSLTPLLADVDWTVRHTTKECLAAMGAAVAPEVLPLLTHADTFARNGAAEVLQNVGVFERLLTLEAEGQSDPDRARTLALLARAGGPMMRDGIVERLSAGIRPQARQLLEAAAAQPPVAQEA